jgi:hypothetical protein
MIYIGISSDFKFKPSSVLQEVERPTRLLAEDVATNAAKVKAAMEDKRIIRKGNGKGEFYI